MEMFTILTYPDKLLRRSATQLENIDGAVQQIIDRMAATMYRAPGVGLAAAQVGLEESIIVFDGFPGEDKNELKVLINPQIVHKEGEVVSEGEGCLSVPDFRVDVKRAAAVIVEGVDREGNPVRLERDDFLAVVLQHEIDHLNGILCVDYASTLKKGLYKRKMKKQRKKNG